MSSSEGDSPTREAYFVARITDDGNVNMTVTDKFGTEMDMIGWQDGIITFVPCEKIVHLPMEFMASIPRVMEQLTASTRSATLGTEAAKGVATKHEQDGVQSGGNHYHD
jgi:hypothetical protein